MEGFDFKCFILNKGIQSGLLTYRSGSGDTSAAVASEESGDTFFRFNFFLLQFFVCVVDILPTRCIYVAMFVNCRRCEMLHLLKFQKRVVCFIRRAS
ncbi:unnamed protein product [Lathyrus sativus]|nr:unnamed protein product [Lathyrus sativus]